MEKIEEICKAKTQQDAQNEIAKIEVVLNSLSTCESDEERVRILAYASDFFGINYELKNAIYPDY